jgi:putative endonuclease
VPYVYIVRCADDTLYTGWAMDVARRVKAHNAGRGAKYTSTRAPVTVVYTEEVPTVGDALRRERAIKRYTKARKLALCAAVAQVTNGKKRAKVQVRRDKVKGDKVRSSGKEEKRQS